MRSGTRSALISAIIIISTIMIGCGSDDSPMAPPAPPASSYVLSDSTTVVPPEYASDIQTFDSTTGAISLISSSDYGQEVEVGDIIIGQNETTAPHGFLRKITAKTTDRSSIILQTEPSDIADAFEYMAITDSMQLRPSQVKTSKMLNGSTLLPDKDDKTFTIDLNCILFDQDGDHDTTEDQIKLVGQYSFDAELFAEIEIDYFELTKFETSIKTEKEVSLQLLANLQWEFDREAQFDLAELRLGAIPIGGVVWMVPTLTVEAHIHGDLTVTFETGITYTETMTNGFGYANNGFYQIKSSSKNFNYTHPSFGAEFNFETGASLNASCLLYGVAGPYMAGKVGFQFQAGLSANPCAAELDFGLDAILYAVIGIECDILDLDYNYQYQLYLHEIGEWTIPLNGVGTVNINTSPDNLNAGWALTGPCSFTQSGNGDLIIPDMAAGDYSITWNQITGWATPQNQALTLVDQGMATFNGNYINLEGTGTITVNAEPDSINATWVITGPNAYHYMGEGDETIEGLIPGSYYLNWHFISGWLTPDNRTATVTEGSTLEFEGIYTEDPGYGSIEISVEPDAINAPWVLSGPESYSFNGQGDQTVTELLPGEYSLVWGDVEGWIKPDDAAITLNPYGITPVAGTYVEETGFGTVIVNTNPDEINASWTLYGPNGYTTSGAGDQSITDREAGYYSISWGMIEGYVTPAYGSDTLVSGGSISFNGTYVGSARIEIDPNPNALNAPWSITSTDGYSNSGIGDATLTELVPGTYTITWESVPGYVSPPDSTQLLWDMDFVNFSCVYSEESIALLNFVPIAPGSFTMGSDVASNEVPHEVTLTSSLQMSNTEITNAQMVSALQYAYNYGYITCNGVTARDALDGSTVVLVSLVGNNTASRISFADHTFSTTEPNQPVVTISWYGAAAYCDWLSLQDGLPRAYNHSSWSCNAGNPYTASGYRLPTEAEWEYACRAGSTTLFNTGDCLNANTQANYDGTEPYDGCDPGQNLASLTDVASYSANGWGLYDMHGNAVEWCNDNFGDYAGDETNPTGVPSSTGTVVRGGSYFNGAGESRTARRNYSYPSSYSEKTGVRIVKSSG